MEELVSFAVGEKFAYDELKTKVNAYEISRSVQLCHSDSRTLEAAKKRVPKKVERARKDLVYYHINLSCVFGGKKYQSKGSGKRPHQRYMCVCVCVCVFVCVCVCVFKGKAVRVGRSLVSCP